MQIHGIARGGGGHTAVIRGARVLAGGRDAEPIRGIELRADARAQQWVIEIPGQPEVVACARFVAHAELENQPETAAGLLAQKLVQFPARVGNLSCRYSANEKQDNSPDPLHFITTSQVLARREVPAGPSMLRITTNCPAF